MQLRDKISRALAEFLPNPEVAVAVTDVRSMRVSVLGEVQKPGVLELRGTTTILEAIAMAGGFRDFASPSKITVIRTDAGGQTPKIRFNYNRAVSNGSSDEKNLVLKPGDVVVVPCRRAIMTTSPTASVPARGSGLAGVPEIARR